LGVLAQKDRQQYCELVNKKISTRDPERGRSKKLNVFKVIMMYEQSIYELNIAEHNFRNFTLVTD
jgi:hypothetical protein